MAMIALTFTGSILYALVQCPQFQADSGTITLMANEFALSLAGPARTNGKCYRAAHSELL
jgi:hypothetical protein